MAKAKTHFVLTNVKIDYPHFLTPYKSDFQDKAKYGCVILIDKQDTEQIKNLNLFLKQIAQWAMSEKWNNIKPPTENINPLKDGDGVKRNGLPYSESYKGHYILNCSSTNAPGLRDEYKKEVTDEKKFYRGCFCHISVDFFAYNKNGNKGISTRLVNVMFVKDGERLGGDPTADEDFASFPVATPAPAENIDFGISDELPF